MDKIKEKNRNKLYIQHFGRDDLQKKTSIKGECAVQYQVDYKEVK